LKESGTHGHMLGINRGYSRVTIH